MKWLDGFLVLPGNYHKFSGVQAEAYSYKLQLSMLFVLLQVLSHQVLPGGQHRSQKLRFPLPLGLLD